MFGFITNLWKKWPLTIVIRELRGGETRWVFDKGARVTRADGVDVIEMKRIKDSFPAPPYSDYGLSAKGGSILEVFSPKSKTYIPIKHKPTKEGLESLYLADSNVDEWHALETQRLAELTKPDIPWWQANFPLIVMMIMGGIFAVVLILTYSQLPAILSAIGNVAEKNLQVTERLVSLAVDLGLVTAPPTIG